MQHRGEWGEDALACNDAILARDPADAAATIRRARCLRALGRLDEAPAGLDALIDQDPSNSVAASQAAKTRRRLHARARAERLLATGATELFDAVELAKRAERDHDFQIEGRRLLARRDRTIEAACALGAAQHRGDDLAGALNTYRWAWQQHESADTSAMALVAFAGVLRDLHRLSDAEGLLRAALRVRPRDDFAQLALAAVLMDRAEHRGARDTLTQARRLLDRAWAAGTRGAAISAAYGRLRSLE